jgi:alkylated DNA nucleotide flippase Atl1
MNTRELVRSAGTRFLQLLLDEGIPPSSQQTECDGFRSLMETLKPDGARDAHAPNALDHAATCGVCLGLLLDAFGEFGLLQEVEDRIDEALEVGLVRFVSGSRRTRWDAGGRSAFLTGLLGYLEFELAPPLVSDAEATDKDDAVPWETADSEAELELVLLSTSSAANPTPRSVYLYFRSNRITRQPGEADACVHIGVALDPMAEIIVGLSVGSVVLRDEPGEALPWERASGEAAVSYGWPPRVTHHEARALGSGLFPVEDDPVQVCIEARTATASLSLTLKASSFIESAITVPSAFRPATTPPLGIEEKLVELQAVHRTGAVQTVISLLAEARTANRVAASLAAILLPGVAAALGDAEDEGADAPEAELAAGRTLAERDARLGDVEQRGVRAIATLLGRPDHATHVAALQELQDLSQASDSPWELHVLRAFGLSRLKECGDAVYEELLLLDERLAESRRTPPEASS